ncbi:phytoene desaturase family protein [Rhodoplanes sp. Z2-YC6860]|uniref:phytoene desaturase family protein n=1 Tax=Rhodoplanes sp. Z2-YC6860 TaxID=674703 RepID=UPI00078CF515|nr:NAD(P)/FAD-dependent oxidoreductase [Rhodoplanes sp. Z2-YC6860]AMN38854.1 FAD dependent oxidoreductase [Rhodoplanes sp. Z2-YC6860]
MPGALERSYDGIIVGAGHHGLVLGSYLAKSGLDILLVDRRLKYGGGLSTEEVTAPGFYHNLHSINHFHISETPWFKDLNLGDRVTYITPRYELGQPHLDGSALVFGRDLEETLANVARFSKRDAATFRDWNRRAEEITRSIFLPERYSEPLPQAEREALLSQSAIGRDFLAITRRQPFEVVKELFENEHVQLLFLFKVSLFGTWLVDTMSGTSPMGSVIRAFDLESGYQLCQGGSFNLARGLMETFIAAGGRYQPQVNIDNILIEGGKASGIVLRDGRTVRAKQFVASTLDVHQTFETLIGREQMPTAFLKKLDGFQYTKWSLYGLHLAMHEPARLTSEAFDPNIGRTLKWSLGAESMEDLMAAHKDVVAGKVPSLVQFGCGPLSVIDPTQAPSGKHTQYAWHVMPLDPDLGEQDYEDFKEEFAEKIIEVFARYAPNMTRKNIIGQHVYTGREYVAEFPQMRGGDIFMGAFNAEQVMYNHFGYRTPIERLYMAGSAAHPGGAISGGSGYISAGIIARELGLKPWWKPWDAREALSKVPVSAAAKSA